MAEHTGHLSLEQRIKDLETWQSRIARELNGIEQRAKNAERHIADHQTRLLVLEADSDDEGELEGAVLLADAIDNVAAALRSIASAMSGHDTSTGHFSMHVTAVELKEDSMPGRVDHTPELRLAASTVRGRITVVGPKKPTGEYLTHDEVAWRKSQETETGAIELAEAPDGTVEVDDPTWVDPNDGSVAPKVSIPTFATFVNTPLTPPEGTRAGGLVTVSGTGMSDCDKFVSYGDEPAGHFTMLGSEEPEA